MPNRRKSSGQMTFFGDFAPKVSGPRVLEPIAWRKGPLRQWMPRKHRSMDEVAHPSGNGDELKKVFRNLLNGRVPCPLLVHGEPGRGKTCAALALCDFVELGCFYKDRALHDRMTLAKTDRLCTSDGRKVGLAEAWEQWKRAGLCVLDDLAINYWPKDKPTPFYLECMQRALDEREDAALIVITNLEATELGSRLGDHIKSRLMAGTQFELTGVDRRQA